VTWVGAGGLTVLMCSFLYSITKGPGNAPGLIAILTPANLFTGVLACGFICVLAAWTDWNHLPRGLRMGTLPTALNLIAGCVFLLLGFKGYWDHSGWTSWLMLGGTLAAGWIAALKLKKVSSSGASADG
jgi:hypothetical protein